MNNSPSNPDLQPGDELQAALMTVAWEWIFRLRQDDVTQEELAQWLNWYEADEQHKAAYDYMQTLFQQTGRVTEGQDPLPAELWLGELARPRAPVARGGSWRRWRRHPAVWATAATIAVCTTLLALQLRVQPQEPGSYMVIPGDTAADAGPVRATSLPDGSRIELAAKTAVSVQMTDKQRTVVMQQGAAYFTVAHNATRPFIVRTGAFNVRAVGTAFNVRNAGGRVVVTVAEGTVDVYPNDSSVSVRARAGTEVAWSPGTDGPVVTSVDPAHALAWQQGNLDYMNEPLESVVADLNRYAEHRIVIADPAAGAISISGTVRTAAAEAWLRALPGVLPVEVRSNADGTLVLGSGAAERSGSGRDSN